jgi:predicted PurR-regulated permease PerM
MYGVVSGYVTGQLTVSAIGATCAGLFVFIISFIFPDVPKQLAMPTAAITFLLSLIPMFGATIGGIIITLLLALNSIPAAIVYAIYFVVYQQIENSFISPHIQSKKNDLTALMVLGAVTIGLYMFGVIGGIIAIPIAGSIRILIQEFLENRNNTPDSKKVDPKIRLVSSEDVKKKA